MRIVIKYGRKKTNVVKSIDKKFQNWYNRFDSFIEFKELKAEDVNKIIDLKYEKYINELNEEDKSIINKVVYNEISLIDSLKLYSSRIKNVREIDNLIKELILGELLNNELK